MIGCAYWINTQWDAGSAALTLTAISCVLYSSTPSPINSVSTLLKAVLLLSVVCFVVKFGLMIQIDDFWVFCAFLFPILVTMQMLAAEPALCRALGAADRLYGVVPDRQQPAEL